MRLQPGDDAPEFGLPTASGETWRLAEVDGACHVQFYRYAGCPSCLLHVRRYGGRIDEVRDAGIEPVAVFHSPVDDLRETCDGVPYPVLADSTKEVFRAYGVETDWRGLLSWRTLRDTVVAMLEGHRWRPSMAKVGWTGLPADFLIDDGTIVAAHYGTDFADSWSVDDVLERAGAAGRTA